MVKPLLPLTILLIWAILFEDRIWDNWSTKEPLKRFQHGDLQWEYEMDPVLANKKYKFKMVQFEGRVTGTRNDTIELDGTLICKLDPSQSVGSSGVSDMQLVNMKGRIIGYDQEKKQVRIDHGFLFQETTDTNDQDLYLRKDQKQDPR